MRGKRAAFDIQRQTWQYKVKHETVEEAAMVLTNVKVPAVLLIVMTSA